MRIADNLNEAMAPWQTEDLTAFNAAIAIMFEQVEELAFDSDDSDEEDGWAILLDVDRCPSYALPYLAQFVGVVLPLGISEDDARERIRHPPNWIVGSPDAVKAAVARTLTATKTIILRERDAVVNPEDAAYGLTVITLTSETPDPVATEQAIRATMNPNNLRYIRLSGQDWQGLRNRTGITSWTSVKTKYTSWTDVMSDQPAA